MCGNGVRLFAKYVFDAQIIPSLAESVQKADLEVETLAGIIHTSIHLNHQRDKQRTSEIVVDMGIPSLSTLPLQIEDALNGRITNFTENLKVDGT